MSEYAVKIADTETQKRHETYIDNIKVGNIIAFKISENVAVSAKVSEIWKDCSCKVAEVICTTKNEIIYQVPRGAILWVKTGARWPRFVMDLFKKKEG